MGEIYYVAHRPQHRWYYFPEMHRDEALLLKCFDTDTSLTRFGAHTAFPHPKIPVNVAPRESIEARTFAFFAAARNDASSYVMWDDTPSKHLMAPVK